MATKKTAAKKPAKVEDAAPEFLAQHPEITAEPIADSELQPPKASKPKYAEDDNSIDARMWRLEQDHRRMGSR